MMKKSSLDNSMNIKRQTKTAPTGCKICEAPAIYSYYGVISCQSCKMFFKRNAQRGQETLKCDFDGHCEINLNTRHVCSYCRLGKCLTSGMQIEMIRSSRSKANKRIRKKKAKVDSVQTTPPALVTLNKSEQTPTLNLLESDQPTLSVDQWNLISNLSHCYDQHSGLSIGERFMREQYILPLKIRLKSAALIELIQMILDESQLLYKNNRDFLSLSADDRSILLHNTIKHVASLSSNFIIYKVQLMDYPTYYNVVENITHSGVASATKRLAGRLDFDVIIMKLFLFILSFSTIGYTIYVNNPPVNLSNIKEILRIQDTYIELTWRYLLHKYDFERAVKCLSDLIRCFFAVDETVIKTHEVQWFTDTIHSIVQQTEQALVVNN